MEPNSLLGNEMVALFVDFENIRYSALNTLELDIDPQLLMAKARKYGRVNVANAYADFSRQPEFYKRSLEAAGIARVDVPIKVSNNREQSVVDLYMVMDVFDTLLDRPQIGTFILMTGDRDFVRICAKLKHQFDKKVVISGIPGSISNDLVASATHFDPLDLPVTDTNRRKMRERQVIRYLGEVEPLSKLPPSYTWLRVKLLEPASRLNMTMEEADIILSDLVKRNVLAREVIFLNGRDYRTTYLNRHHPTVLEVLGQSRGELPRFITAYALRGAMQPGDKDTIELPEAHAIKEAEAAAQTVTTELEVITVSEFIQEEAILEDNTGSEATPFLAAQLDGMERMYEAGAEGGNPEGANGRREGQTPSIDEASFNKAECEQK